MQIITSTFVSVSMDVDPNKLVHTSPDTFADDENILTSMYPIASEPTDRIAISASPLILVFSPSLSNMIATIIVIGIVSRVSLARLSTAETDIAPNAT